MRTITYGFSKFAKSRVESTKLQEAIVADASLPKLSHVDTVKPLDEEGTVFIHFDTDVDLTSAQTASLNAIVAAHDADVAELQLTQEDRKQVVDTRTANYQSIRQLAAMTQQEIDADGDATKAAIDVATTIDDCIAAAEADPRPALVHPVGRASS